jgi:hypothetical protein
MPSILVYAMAGLAAWRLYRLKVPNTGVYSTTKLTLASTNANNAKSTT